MLTVETAREEAVRELPKRASGSRPSTSGTKRKNDADEADVNNDGPRTRRGRASDPGPGPLKRRRIPSKRAEEAAKQAELKAASRTPRKRTKSSPSKTPTKRAARSTTRSPAKKTPARKLGGTIFDGVLMPAVTRRTPRGKETQAHDDDVDAEGDDEDPADQVGDAGNHVVLSSSSGNGSSDKGAFSFTGNSLTVVLTLPFFPENETVLPGAGGRSETGGFAS